MKLFDFFKSNKGINPEKFNSENFQKEILEKAEKAYFDNKQKYDLTGEKLKEEGLNENQVKEIIEKLKQLNKKRTEALNEELDTGKMKIEIKPSEGDLKPGQSKKDVVDKNIAFGAYQMDRGEFDNALELFDKAIELDDKATLAYANKGTLYSRKGNFEQSLFFYNKALEIEPKHNEILSNKASVLQELGKMDEAMTIFKTILEHHPNDSKALNDLGILYAQKNELETALIYFDRLLAIQPLDQDALYNKLNALCTINLDQAKVFHKSNIANIQSDSLHHFVPSNLDMKGQRAEAEQYYDDLYALTKEDKFIKLKGHFFYSRNPEKAVAIYDQFLERNPNNEEVINFKRQLVSTPESEALFNFLFKYREYIVKFAIMQMGGNFAPIGAFEKIDGSVDGFLYIIGDEEAEFSAQEAVTKMEQEFEQRLKAQSIKSYTIYYHSHFNNDNNHAVANDNLKAISIRYKSNEDYQGYTGIPYTFNGQQYNFQLIAGLTFSQHQQIWSTQLEPNKNYFQSREEITSEPNENEVGIQVKQKYEGRVGDLWKGIIGLEAHAEMQKSNSLMEFVALALSQGTKTKREDIIVTEFEDKEITMKVVSKEKDTNIITFLPVIKTTKSIPTSSSFINEWAHVHHVEARIGCRGRDTFGVVYYATDYALNRERYLSNKDLNIKISGIVYSLDIHKPNPNDDPPLSPDFCGYAPFKDGGEDCFNFIGILKGFKETTFLSIQKFGGYILTVKLINSSEMEDFFTIDMFVSKNNMNFEQLEIGMQLTGLVLFQGEIDHS